MKFGLFDMIAAFFLGLFLGVFYGFTSFALCAIQREEKLKGVMDCWYD